MFVLVFGSLPTPSRLPTGLRPSKYRRANDSLMIGMSVAIAIGAGYFAAFSTMLDPSVPLDEGERIVSIQNVDTRTADEEDRILHDFVVWRDELRSIRDVAAMHLDSRNLIVEGRTTELVEVAAMTASGFRVARVAPPLGRPVLEDDERRGAPPVVLIAEEVWQDVFDRDPDVLGRSVRLGGTAHTVIGVMPAGFRFPYNHRFWIPLRLDPPAHERGAGPAILVFGRLADGATVDAAEAELTTIAARLAAEFPETNERLRPRVLPYTYPFVGVDSVGVAWGIRVFQFAIGMLLMLVAVNIAILIYARTATRTGEIAVRSALGASRGRVMTQLFAEALVLSGTAAAIGLTIAAVALGITQEFLANTNDGLAFWIEFGLSPGTIVYVAGLAILAAGIVGVVPGLKATGRRVQAGLQQLSARGSRMQLGRTWTAMIIAQVAIAVAVLPFALYIAGVSVLRGTVDTRYPADSILTASVSVEREESAARSQSDEEDPTAAARYLARTAELIRRLDGEPAIVAVTFASRFPGDEAYARIEVEDVAGSGAQDGQPLAAAGAENAQQPAFVWGRVNQVGTDFFDVFEVPILAGRGFRDSDARDGSNPVIVDRIFAEQVMGGGNVLGRRIRQLTREAGAEPGDFERGPWLEVVGVVPDIAVQRDFDPGEDARVYQPMALAGAPTPLSLMLRVAQPTSSVAARVRDITAQVDPNLQLLELRTAADIESEARQGLLYIAYGIAAVTLSVLLLSAAGIYAMMSFTVARRRREIGMRAALGANPRRLLGSIFARASAQLAAGVLGGLVLAAALDRLAGGALAGRARLLLPAVAALMITVGLVAALGPARRGLAVQRTEALREE